MERGPVLRRGVAIFLAGLILSPLLLSLEESVDLEVLFSLRGQRPPPQEIVLISLDKASAIALNLPEDPDKWPRSLHADLVDRLSAQGAAVIAFDLLFQSNRGPDEDAAFARAMDRAGNVVLCKGLRKERHGSQSDMERGEVDILSWISPVECLRDASVAQSSFVLPKVPVRLSQVWMFRSAPFEVPSLPAVVFQIMSGQAYDELNRLIESSWRGKSWDGRSWQEVMGQRDVLKVMDSLRSLLHGNTLLVSELEREIRDEQLPQGIKGRLSKLLSLYQGTDSRFLNFYGPAGTFQTIPYAAVLADDPGTADIFRNKAVFIGYSETRHALVRDGYHTVFSTSKGIDLSGVEVAATATANILEDNFIMQLPWGVRGLLLLVWAVLLAAVAFTLPLRFFSAMLLVLGGVYLAVSIALFSWAGVWIPLLIPLGVQLPLAGIWSLCNGYSRYMNERRSMQEVFEHYLPEKVVTQLVQNKGRLDRQVLFGTCLHTDGENFSTLSEQMGPQDLSDFMDRYYSYLYEPVYLHGGFVQSVVGDSMMALWAGTDQDEKQRFEACVAAVEIHRASERFNATVHPYRLPTRIGVHSGRIVLGNVGAMNRYEYRAVGDVVNSATRLEGLNKYLGTRVLVSAAVVVGLKGILFRRLGSFFVLGKSIPMEPYEVVTLQEEVTEENLRLVESFEKALDSFFNRSFDQARKGFQECLNLSGSEFDGPSAFYLRLCREFKKTPPGNDWTGAISMKGK